MPTHGLEAMRAIGFDDSWIRTEDDHPDMVAFLEGWGDGVEARFEVPSPTTPRP